MTRSGPAAEDHPNGIPHEVHRPEHVRQRGQRGADDDQDNRIDDLRARGVIYDVRDVTERVRIEAALRKSEAEISSILESITDAFFSLDRELRFTYINPRAAVLFNNASEDLLGERIWEDPTFYPQYRRALAEDETARFEGYYPHVEAWYSVRAYPSESGLAVYLQDITERKRAEQALTESERRFSSVVANAHAFVYRCLNEPGYPNEYASDYALELTGYAPEDLLVGGEVRFGDLIVAEDRQRVWEERQEALEEGRGFELRYALRRKDGQIRHVHEHGQGVYGEDGKVVALEGLVYDVTALAQAQQRVQEAEERYRTLVERIPVVTYIQEPTNPSRTTYLSPQYEKILGYSLEEALSDTNHWIEIIHPEDRERVLEEDRRTNESGNPFVMEYRQYAKSGRVVWIRDEATLVRGELGESLYWFGIQTDVTERKEAERALKESEERYRRRSRELDILHQVRSALSHELDAVDVLCKAVEAVAEVCGYTHVSAYLLEGEDLVLQNWVGYEQVRQRISSTEGIPGRVVRTGRPVLVEDASSDPDSQWQTETVSSEVCIPLLDDGETVGVLDVASPGGKRLGADDLRLLSALGDHVSVAVSRARLHAKVRRSEERLRALTVNSSDVITLSSPTGTIHYQSPSAERILGYEPEEMTGKNFFDYVHPEDLMRVEVAFAEGLRMPERRPSVEYRFRHKEGSWRWLESVGANLLGVPEVDGYVINSRDVTRRKRTEMALRESEQRFRHSFEDAASGMALVGTDGRFLRVNKSLCEIVGYSRRELLESSFQDITYPHDLQKDLDHLRRLLAGEIRTYQIEKRYLHKDGRVVWTLLSVSLITDDKGEPLYLISQVQDVSDRKRIEERLRRQALHDALTGLPSRELFMDRLGHALERTRRTRDRKAAVLFMDLDGFKVINDSLGHEMGDYLLVAVAERLRGSLRPGDTLARFGGDEFVVLLEDVEDPGDAIRVARRITEEFRSPFILEDRSMFASVSIGIALGAAQTRDPHDLLRDADTAMYRAKDELADYRVFDPSMYERVVRRLELENDLRRAIEDEEFVVHYQPIVHLNGGEVWGVEALVRWRHPERGLLNPDEFVPAAEESGLVVPMCEGVLEDACRRAKEWQEGYPRTTPLVVSVNLSTTQLFRPNFIGSVERALRETGLEGSCLSLDITETAYVTALEGDTTVLEEIRERGMGISIDDFGTGYSSLSYLKSLPADILKIDRSFVRGLGKDTEDTVVVRVVIELAHTFGMEVVAEGVETWAQAALLAEMGCDYAQGYYFSEPLEPREVPNYLTR